MNIVHITTVHPAFDQRILFRQCVAIARAGHNISLIAHSDEDTVYDGVNIVSLGKRYELTPRLRVFHRLSQIFRALKLGLKKKADIYHIHDPELLLIAPLIKLFAKSKVVFDSHEDNAAYALHKPYIPRHFRKVLSVLFNEFEKLSLWFLDGVITADPGVQNKFKRMGAVTDVLYNFPRLELFRLAERKITRAFDLVYHGTIPRYHMEACLAIDEALLNRGKKVRWLFLCRIKEMPWVETMLSDSQKDRITVRDQVAHDKVSEEIIKAKIGIIPLPDLPKFQSNIPSKLFEFMALGMPVVMSDLPPSRQFIHNSDCAFMVPPGDYDAFAKAIIKLLDNPELMENMGNEGRKKVKSSYNWEMESRKLIRFYSMLSEDGLK